MGSPLNSNVPKGRSVHLRQKALAQLHSVANDAQCVPPTLGMPKSRDFLLALLPGFSDRIHPGIFWSRDKQKLMIPGFLIPGFFALSFGISRDIPGFIFCSNGYILSLSNIKFSSLNANIMLCFRTFLSEHLFQNTCFKTHVSEHMFQSTCFWTTISEHLYSECI